MMNTPLKAEDLQIAEVVIIEGSRFQGRTLSGLRFVDRYGLITLAIHRAGKPLEKLHDEVTDIRLKSGVSFWFRVPVSRLPI